MQALDTATEVSFSPLLHSYTLEEFWALPDPDDRSHYELIGGFLSWFHLLTRLTVQSTPV